MNDSIRLEYNINDSCNLKCAGCATFSPLVKRGVYKSLNKIKDDFKRIYELTENGKKIRIIRIIGGEPLLHPDLNEALIYISTLFCNSEIHMFTNGILIPKMNLEFFEVLRKYITLLYVSVYPSNIDYNKILQILDKNEILYIRSQSYQEGVRSFFYQYLKEDYTEDYKSVYENCRHNNLYFLKDNKIYTCTQIAYFNYFDEEFKGEHTLKVTEEDYIDLNKINSFDELKEAKKKAPRFCGNCIGDGMKNKMREWKISQKDISEWLDPN